MLNFFKKLLYKLGIDKAIGYTVLTRLLQASGGIITLLFIVAFLTEKEQGYYYTFGSILALQIFFELGLSGIITQYVAHETADLDWLSNTQYSGPNKAISRIASLLRFSVKWFTIVSILLFVVLLIAGFVFFNFYGNEEKVIKWEGAWILLCLTTSSSFVLSLFFSFLEGLGKIQEIAKIRFFQQVVQIATIFLFFNIGLKLYSAPLAYVCALLVSFLSLFFSELKVLLKAFWMEIGEYKVNYRTEIFPFQWKIALSWVSGYFIFQLFNPVLFATEGAIIAGQMGITITVLSSILNLTLSWATTKIPIYSKFIAEANYRALDALFTRTLLQSTVVNILCLTCFLIILYFIRSYNVEISGHYFGDRFLAWLPLFLMLVPTLLNHVISSLATYLRCHKREPLLLQSIVVGILCAISTITLGSSFGVNGITFGYCSIMCLSFVWTVMVFLVKRKEWHHDA